MKERIVDRDIVLVRELLDKAIGTVNFTDIERMGGLTNRTYKVTYGNGQAYVVRIPGEGTEELIDRVNEKVSTLLACQIGIDAELLYFGQQGEKVTTYIDRAVTMSADTIRQPQNLIRVAEVFRKLHTCGADTQVPFEVFHMAAAYEKIIFDNHVVLYADYPAIKKCIMDIKRHIDRNGAAPRVPCHNDPLCENWVLDGRGRMYLIDWEYAGMNDCLWDLADVSVEAALSQQEDAILLEAYFKREPLPDELERFQANKLYLDYLWTLWGKTRVPYDGESMEQYAAERYTRLKNNLRLHFEEWYPEQ